MTSALGIISTQQVTWSTWEPGGEYTKVIKLKNVDTKTHKIKYRLPRSKCFSTKFPETITLCSGNTAKIPITFKPLDKELYTDEVEFFTKSSSFTVNVKAVLPKYSIDLPHSMEFGNCGVQSTISRTFTLVNKSIETYFKWDVAHPFTIEPALGLLQEKGHCEVTIKFSPSEALVYDSTAVVSYGNGQHDQIQICGIGKHPYIMIGDGQILEEHVHSILDFGEVPIGTSASKTFDVKNMSSVNAIFDISQNVIGTVAMDKVFSCKNKAGSIQPNSISKVKINFLPTIENMDYTDYFYISPAGCPSQCVVKCVGKSVAPKVELSSKLVSYNYVECGREAQHFITIKNASNVKTFFQVALDSKENVFSIDKSCGTLEPKAEIRFLIKFLPVKPIPYYKRVTVLVHRQDPLFLDLIGSGFTGDFRPALLTAPLLRKFFEKVRNGMSVYPPEVQETMLANSDNPPSLVSGVPSVDLPPCVQYFGDSQLMSESCTLHMTLDLEYLDFGKCHAFQRVHHKTVTITNHTRGRVTAIWTDKSGSTFTVLPAEVDIPPFKSTSFRVNFHPQDPNKFYGADLECVTFYKCMRETQLITDETISAPWSLSLYCSGETFEPNHEPFLPRYDTDTPALLFPPTLPDQAVFRTLLLKNTGDTPMAFNFEDDPMGLFCVKPVSGIVDKDVAIIVVRMLANQARTYQYNLKCTLNTKHIVNFPCIAAVEQPSVWLENKKVMFFKPTCIGSVAEQWYGVRNTSRLPLNFEWRAATTDNLTVSPVSGVIMPNDTQYQLWKYSPKEEVRERSLNTLSIYHLKNNRRKMTVSIVGQGAQAYLECVPATVDFGILVVGEMASDTVSLHNPHSCTTEYKLTFEYEGLDKCPVKLDKMYGSLTAYGKEELHLTYKPTSCADYKIKVLADINGESKVLLTIDGQGVFPKLSFIDIRSMGVRSNASKKRLWDLFSLDLLNKYLEKAPDTKELRQLMETRSNEKTKPISTKALAVMDFGSDTAGTSHSSVVIVMKNNGKVATNFKFLFPPDLCLDMQTWAEDSTGQDQQEMFEISPKDGCVQPGDTLSLVFTFRHVGCGRKELPVLLKLSRGREVLINLRGVTVPPGSPYPQFAHLSHTLAPVVIGSNNPPIQYYELYNGGDAPLSFEVIKDTLDQLAADNYGMDVLQCLQTTGRVQPHSISHIPFLFSPLEVRTYAVEVPIYIIGGDTYHVTLFGEGILPTEVKETQTGGVPGEQALLLDNQLAKLSLEAIDFETVPTFSISHKIIFVTNTSNESITFRWNTNTTPISGEVLTVTPSSGTLAPGSSTMIQVSLNPTSYPAFFDLDIICELTDNSKEDAYLAAIAKYEHDMEESKITFTIKEALPGNPPDLDKSMDNWVAADQLNKYNALPPIRALAPSPLDRPQKRNFTCGKSGKHGRKAAPEKKEKVWAAPEAPKPFYLHLRVLGHVEDIKTFSGDLRNFDIPVASFMNPDNHFSPDVQEVNDYEVNTISKVLSYVLKSLLDDVDVHRAITNLSDEQIPYFAQIRRDQPEVASLEEVSAEAAVEGAVKEALVEAAPAIADAEDLSDYSLAPLLTDIIEQALANILQESVNKEVTLTARPRIIALPPRSPMLAASTPTP